jgi:2'-5' RNA ligase
MENSKLIRCFIALELSREAINEVEEIQKLVKKKNFFFGKFTEPENLHLTIKFLGEISEERIKEVQENLRRIKLNSFEASLGEIGCFSEKIVRILWIKLLGKEIWELQKEIDKSLEGVGFKPEERFMSHITIARIKKVINKKEFLDYIKSLKHRKVRFKIKEFCLKKSELMSDGPVYTDVERYNL